MTTIHRRLAALLRDHLAKHRCGLCLEWHPFGMEPHRDFDHHGEDDE